MLKPGHSDTEQISSDKETEQTPSFNHSVEIRSGVNSKFGPGYQFNDISKGAKIIYSGPEAQSRKKTCLEETPPKSACQLRADLTVLTTRYTLEINGNI